MIPNAQRATLLPIIERMILPDSIVYTDALSSYDALDVSDFHHVRTNHSELFADRQNHINGIENFWNQAKRHLRRFNGIPKDNFYLFLKECEWRFNGGNHKKLLKQLKQWIKKRLLSSFTGQPQMKRRPGVSPPGPAPADRRACTGCRRPRARASPRRG